MFCAFIDFEKAFDKVWRDGLWYKLFAKSAKYENEDVMMFREVNCKMRLFAMKYSFEFEEKID
jgi:hypothetical protein